MKMESEQRRQAMFQLHLNDQQFYCLVLCVLYKRFDGRSPFPFAVSGFSLSVFPVSDSVTHSGIVFVISPMMSIKAKSCLTFRYFLRYSLKLYITNSSAITLMADLHVDGGFDFHQTFIDLPVGSYQIIWELHLGHLEPVEIVRNYRTAIDDVEISLKTCTVWRRY